MANADVQYLAGSNANGGTASKVDSFTVSAADGTTKVVSFTINGTNDAAVIGTPTVTDVAEDSAVDALGNLVAAGSISVSDVDAGQAIFATTVSANAANLGSLVLAANGAYGPLFCYWDEPDNYLALSEVGNFVLALRKAFRAGGQFIATSHNAEAIRRFSDENTFVLYRKNHLEPTIVRPLTDIKISGDLVGALARGDVEP